MRRFLIIALAVVAVIVVVAVVAVRLFLPPEKVRQMAVERAGEALGVEVRLDEAKVSLLPAGIRVRGLVVENPVDGSPPLIDLREGSATVRLLPLLSRRVEIAGVKVDSAVVTVVMEEDGGDVAAGPVGEPGPADGTDGGEVSSFALFLPRADLSNVTLHLIDQAAGGEYVFEGLAAQTSLRASSGGGPVEARGTVSAAKVRAPQLADAGFAEGLGDFLIRYEAEYRPAEGTARIDDLRFRFRDLELDVTGELKGLPDAPAGDVVIATPEVEFAELVSLLPSSAPPALRGLEGSGPLSIDGELHFSAEAPPLFRIAVDLGGLDVRNPEFSESIENLRGRIVATDSRTSIEEVTFDLGGKPFRLSGAAEEYDDPLFDLTAAGAIDLVALGRAGLVPEDLTVEGVVDLDLRARGRASKPEGARLDGTIDLAGLAIRLDAPPIDLAGGNGRVLMEGDRLRAERIAFDFNGSPTELQVAVARPLGDRSVTFDLGTRKIDFDAFLPADSAGPGATPGEAAPGTGATPPIVLPPLPPITLAGTVHADTIVTGGNLLTGAEAEIDAAGGSGTVRIRMTEGTFGGVAVRGATGDLRVGGEGIDGDWTVREATAYRVPFQAARGRITLDPAGTLRLDGVHARVYEGSVAGSAEIGLGGDPSEAPYRIEASAESLETNDFLSDLTPAKDILYGTFNMESVWEGRGLTEEELLRNLSAEGTMQSFGGELRNLAILDQVGDLLGLKEVERVPFREMWSKFAVQDGRVRFDDLEIRSADADWSAAGSIGFDGTLDYEVTVVLSKAISDQYRSQSSLTSLFANADGRVVLDFLVGGTSKKPVITYDASKTASRAGIQNLDGLIESLGGEEKVQKTLDGLLGDKNPLKNLFGNKNKKKD